MTDIMSIINKLFLALQKQTVLLVDINHYFAITLAQLHQLMKTDNSADFPVLNAFHPFHLHNVPDKPSPSFGQEEAEIIFKHYGNSKVDILENI